MTIYFFSLSSNKRPILAMSVCKHGVCRWTPVLVAGFRLARRVRVGCLLSGKMLLYSLTQQKGTKKGGKINFGHSARIEYICRALISNDVGWRIGCVGSAVHRKGGRAWRRWGGGLDKNR